MPRPTITRNDQNTIATGGCSSLGTSFRPGTTPSHSWVRIMLARLGMPISKWLVCASWSGMANSNSGTLERSEERRVGKGGGGGGGGGQCKEKGERVGGEVR